MPDLVKIPMTPAQVQEFQRLTRAEVEAQRQVAGIPFARTATARGIVLGHYAHGQFDDQQINVDLDTMTIHIVVANQPPTIESAVETVEAAPERPVRARRAAGLKAVE